MGIFNFKTIAVLASIVMGFAVWKNMTDNGLSQYSNAAFAIPIVLIVVLLVMRKRSQGIVAT